MKEPYELEAHGFLQLRPDAKRLRAPEVDDETLRREIENADHGIEITSVRIIYSISLLLLSYLQRIGKRVVIWTGCESTHPSLIAAAMSPSRSILTAFV